MITDPTMFYPSTTYPSGRSRWRRSLDKLEDAQVFVIVNKVEQQLTGNLRGPLVVNTIDRTGEQTRPRRQALDNQTTADESRPCRSSGLRLI